MRRLRHIVLAVALVLAVMQPAASARAAVPDRARSLTAPHAGVSATQLTVRVESKGAMERLEAVLRRTGGTILGRSADGDAVLVEAPAAQDSADYAESIAAEVPVSYAGAVGIVTASAIPSDPYYHTQWGLPKVGAPAAWDRTWGSASAIIAIIDSGVALDHPELVNRIQPGGKDFVPNPDDFDPSDENGHGTGVAGIAVSERDNELYGVGMAPDCKILPLRVLDARGEGNMFDLSEAIRYAADQGADVINMSLGGPNPDPNLALAIQYALDRDVVIVAASGNQNAPSLQYPAAYPGVVAVGATTQSDARWTESVSGSNYGANLDLMAPGLQVNSIRLEPGFFAWTGTSMAAPFVAATAALMRTIRPTASEARIVSELTSTALDLGAAGWDDQYGWGRLRADAAVNAVVLPETSISFTTQPNPYGWHTLAPTITLISDATGPTRHRWDNSPEVDYSGPLLASEGVHALTYRSVDAGGAAETPKIREFRVDTVRPSTPAGVLATALGTNSVRVEWAASTDVTSGVREYEVRRTPAGPALATSGGTSAIVPGLAPATPYAFYVVASDVAGNLSDASAPASATTASAAALVSVFRLFNAATGTHFFTPSAQERDTVISAWPGVFNYEGVAYSVYPSNNSQPLYRFYNRRSASHFYTASAAERDIVIRTWPHIFTYEGETHRVTPTAEPGKLAVYRFYNLRNGSHFYTASVEERNAVIARWPDTYRYEGPAFWLGQ